MRRWAEVDPARLAYAAAELANLTATFAQAAAVGFQARPRAVDDDGDLGVPF